MPHHILIHVPAFGQIWTTATALASHALRDHLHMKGLATGISSLSFPDIAELRAMVMTIWYDTMPQSDYLLFVDADMSFPPEHVVDMILFNEPLIGTIYPQRQMPLSWAGSGTGAPTTERRGNFILVEGVGFGCTLMKREVVTTMLAKFPELVDYRIQLHPAGKTLLNAGTNRIIRAYEKLDIPDRGLISEDLSFCLRWARCGGQTWAHIGSKISHVGPYDYGACYLTDVIEKQMMVAQQEQIAMAAQQTIPQPMKLEALPVQALPQSITTYVTDPLRAGTESVAVYPSREYMERSNSEWAASISPSGRDGAPAMIDALPIGMEKRQLEAAE